MKKLVEEGKIKFYGLSEASPDQIRRANAIHPLACIQQEWSLGSRDLEYDLVPVCKELDIGIVCYSPLARGIFAKNISSIEDFKDWRTSGAVGYLSAEHFDKNLEIVNRVKKVSEELGEDVSALALAWLLRQGDNVVAIPGTTKIDNLRLNLSSIKLAERLDQEVIDRLSEITKEGFSGSRYEGMAHHKREKNE